MSTTAPYVANSDTSLAAAASMEPHLERLEATVLYFITISDDTGLTCDQLEELTDLSHQTCSARLHALFHKKHLIRDSGLRRKTRSGRAATVWLVNR